MTYSRMFGADNSSLIERVKPGTGEELRMIYTLNTILYAI